MTFEGFTLPDGAWLPPELMYLLPELSYGQLKVTIVVLYTNMQVGGEENLSLIDIQHMTGLSRPAVSDALRDLLYMKVIDRRQVGQSYVNFPVVKLLNQLDSRVSKVSLPVQGENSKDLNRTILTDSLSTDSLDLIKQMRAAGIYLKTAQALVAEHDQETIEQAFRYFRHALAANLAQGPGWLVSAIREGWDNPLGWVDNGIGGCNCNKCKNNRAASHSDAEESLKQYAAWTQEED